MNTYQEFAPGVDECILDAFLMSFIHQNRGRSNHFDKWHSFRTLRLFTCKSFDSVAANFYNYLT